ncbi:MAG: hypothetical protein R3C31_05125 [Hyphomonadaceae bacterium]
MTLSVHIQIEQADTAFSMFRVLFGLVPVLLGAGIAFFSTWWFARRAERFRRRGLGYALVMRANEAFNNIKEIERVLTVNLHKVGKVPHLDQKWQVVQIATGFDWKHTISFAPEELAILVDARQHGLINELAELSRLHNILNIMMGEYVVRRENLTRELRAASTPTVDGTQIASLVDNQVTERLKPDIMLIEDLLGQIIEKAVDGAGFAEKVVTKAGPIIKVALKDKKFAMSVQTQTGEPNAGE